MKSKNFNLIKSWALVLAMFALAFNASAIVVKPVVISDTIDVHDDAWLRSDVPGTNYSSDVRMGISTAGTNDGVTFSIEKNRPGLLRFELPTTIQPAGSVTLNLSVQGAQRDYVYIYGYQEMDWDEDSITWNTANVDSLIYPYFDLSCVSDDSAFAFCAENNIDTYLGRFVMSSAWRGDSLYHGYDVTAYVNKCILEGKDEVSFMMQMPAMNKWIRLHTKEGGFGSKLIFSDVEPVSYFNNFSEGSQTDWKINDTNNPNNGEFAEVKEGALSLSSALGSYEVFNYVYAPQDGAQWWYFSQEYPILAFKHRMLNKVSGDYVSYLPLDINEVQQRNSIKFRNTNNRGPVTTFGASDSVLYWDMPNANLGGNALIEGANENVYIKEAVFGSSDSLVIEWIGTFADSAALDAFIAIVDDATLSDVQLDGTSLTGFDADTYVYDSVPVSAVPMITATVASGSAYTTYAVTDADSITGTTTIVVTAADGSTQATYTINFVEAPSAAIGDMFTVDNIEYTVANLDPMEVEVAGFFNLDSAIANVVIPATVTDTTFAADYSVVAVGVGAFGCNPVAKKGAGDVRNNVVETVSLPSSVVTLGAHAFRDNPNLTTINLDNVVEAGSNLFVLCSALSDIGSLDSLTTTGGYTFFRCHELDAIDMPNVVTLANGEVYDMDGITQFNIPSSVTNVGTLFLGRNDALKAVQLNWADTTMFTIDATHFFRDMTLADVTLYVPTGTKAMYSAHTLWGQFPEENIIEGVLPAIGDMFTVDNMVYTLTNLSPYEVEVSGFSDLDAGVADLTIPSTVTDSSNAVEYSVAAIGIDAFSCTAKAGKYTGDARNEVIQTVILPTSVKAIGNFAFNNSKNLTTINLENVVMIGKASFSACTSLTETGVLSSCTALGDYAFNLSFTSLSSIEFPILESMGAGAVYDSANKGTTLTKVNIPSTLTRVGTLFLGGHKNLTAVQVNWTSEALDTVAFADTDKFFRWLDKTMITVYVPVGTKAAYEAHALWGTFPAANIVEGEIVSVTGVMLDADSLSIELTKTATLTATVAPAGAADMSVVWGSSDSYVAAVIDGVVHAVGEGTAKIFVTTNDGGFSDTCVVTVVAPAGLSETAMSLVTVYPNPSQDGNITIGGEAGQVMSLEIYSLTGAKVFEKSVLSQEAIATGLNSGIYMLRVNHTSTQKLIIK